ncbi:unnamed protein product [Penicillium bialowiezense]
MGKKKSNNQVAKRKEPTLQDYLSDNQYGKVGCYWQPTGRWHAVHGDSKATSRGISHSETMQTSGEEPVYRVRVIRRGAVVVEFDMPHEEQPADDDVVAELKDRA